MTVWVVFGIAAGALSTVDSVPYIRDVLRGSTRPHRGTWCIWSVLGITAFSSQLADGARWSLLMIGIQAISVTIVFVLSIRRGVGGLGAADLALLALAGTGIAGWFLSSTPLVATVCVVVADLAGASLMLPKAWRDPRSETPSMFALSAVSGLLGAAAVGVFDPGLLVYPVYFAAVNAATAVVIVMRRQAVPIASSL